MLSTTGLGVRFSGLQAVDDVAIDVRHGEIVGVIGPNGAGKTSLFDLISGFQRPTSGRVDFLGHDITELSPSERARRGLGRSFQSARMFPELSVEENLDVAQHRWNPGGGLVPTALHLPMAFDAEDAIDRRTDELVELFGLDGHRHHLVRSLSTGTRRVVDLAGLVAHRPMVVLLDEPSAGIAQREVEALVPLVRRLRDDMGASLLVIDHDLPFLTSICDRIVALDRGRVIAEGTPLEVLAHPAVIESYLGRAVEDAMPATSPHLPEHQTTPDPPVSRR